MEKQIMAENPDWDFYRGVVQGEECQCGRTKKSGFPLCVKCFYALPEDLREGCAYGMSDRLPEAYEAAVKYLED